MNNSIQLTGFTDSDKRSEPLATAKKLARRSWLFVPATRPERFIKAMNSGADAVILDLEDAVGMVEKSQARQNVAQFMQNSSVAISCESTGPSLWLRLNNDSQLEEDLQLCQSLAKHQVLAGVVLPKVTDVLPIQQTFKALNLPVVVQIESAQGITKLSDIAESEGVMAISYGRLDISNQLNLRVGSQAEQDFFDHLRIKLLLTSHTHGLIAPIESVYPDFKNEQGMTTTASYVSDLGFSGMLCIHPSQVAIVNQAFKATADQLAFATKVVEHYQQTGDNIFAIEGVMVDLPVILQCQRLLQQN
ncbi:HpcH/HpaI aldolase/citrate lyase family protein [Psychrobacter sanguinis]|uniref:HpcH/HpaI aldolase/citrate lyase family protein n=1 Tax=Psychrobacter sanguinis TaxID=861445 RepID=UPI001D10F3D1|nr:CoA ester lyase [Psychrobacter sanguinis]MCC3308479.1 CoA ester lyase [Psychrobacter sanguinis]UEC25775.1 CoA ester lyase [Psychrobacter sanguinis]